MRPERPLVCLVTDRRRLCDGCGESAARRCLIEQIRAAAAAGIDILQIRERDLAGAPLAAIVSEAAEIARGTTTRIVVNDRVDVALAAGAHGVHLRADSIPAAAARLVAPGGFLIGRSVHNEAEAAEAGAAVDYLVAGPVFPTSSKPGAERWLGEKGLAGIVGAARVPVLAIGGVTLDVLPRVGACGAAGFAAIGFFLVGNTPCRSGSLDRLVEAARARFDTMKTAP
jgi:thiamine-phosphate diphosphorylase